MGQDESQVKAFASGLISLEKLELKTTNFQIQRSGITHRRCPLPALSLSPQPGHLGRLVRFHVVGKSAGSPGDWSPGRRQPPLGFSITSSL